MLALNVSSEVLDGFELVEDGLLRTVKSSSENNERVFGSLEEFNQNNPEKAKVWYESALQVKERTDQLFNYIQELKIKIVQKADGKEGNPEHLKNPADLNASLEVMFEKGKNDGAKLKTDIDSYREFISSMVTNEGIKHIIESNLSTEPTAKAKENKQTWEESMFSNMPMAAAVTLLTKMQNDIRYAEGQVLSDLLKSIDVTDLRVNTTEVFVIPQSETVVQGGTYRANIVLAAIDSTSKPTIYVNGSMLPESANGLFTTGASGLGPKTLSGYIEMPRGDGSLLRQDFISQYTVVQPSATIAPTMMNVLYAGIDNEISIAVPGIASQNVQASMSNGTLTPKGNGIWVARPTSVGTDAVITVTARTAEGRSQEMVKGTFRVRALPDPSAYVTITDTNGNAIKFEGGPLSKTALLNVETLKAAIDDGLLNIGFTVLRFEIMMFDSMGLANREPSDGAKFSARQKEMIRGLSRGKTIFIRNIETRGPDGVTRTLKSPMEIMIN
jgi:gliding motility-associated protein GldM